MKKGAPLLEGLVHSVTLKNLTYCFSIQYPDGVVQVVSTKGVAVSIAGMKISLSWIFFYRLPSRQASTPCPHPQAETAELSDAVSSTARKIQELK